MAGLTPLPQIPATRQPLDQDGGYFDWAYDLYNYICRLYNGSPEANPLGNVAHLDVGATPDVFARYVGNIQADLNDIEPLDKSRVDIRKQCIRTLAIVGRMEEDVRAWKNAQRTYDYTPVDTLFRRADRIRTAVLDAVPNGSYAVPNELPVTASTISPPPPRIVNENGSDCFLISLFEGLVGDPITRKWIIQTDFQYPIRSPELENFHRILKECVHKYQTAQRTGSTEPLKFSKALREALVPLVQNEDISRGHQCVNHILTALLNFVNPEGNELFFTMANKLHYTLDESSRQKLVNGRAQLLKFSALLENIHGVSANQLKEFLTYIDPEGTYNELNDKTEILKVILIKISIPTEKRLRWIHIVDPKVQAERRERYTTKESYAERMVKAEKYVQDQLAVYKGKRQEIEALDNSEVLAREILQEIERSLLGGLPEAHEDGIWSLSRMPHKRAVQPVSLKEYVPSNTFEAYLAAPTQEDSVSKLGLTPDEFRTNPTKQEIFTTAPNYQFIELTRTLPGGRKVDRKIDLQLSYCIDPKLCADHSGGKYQIRWFCVHRGGGSNGGHYVNYRMTTTSSGAKQWYCHDDQANPRSYPVDDTVAQEKLRECTLFFAHKTDSTMTKEQLEIAVQERIDKGFAKAHEEQFLEIGKPNYRGDRESSYIELFSNELTRKEPNLELLQRIFVSLASTEFTSFVEFALKTTGNLSKNTPIEDQLLELKTIAVDLLASKVKGHIVAQYAEVRKQRQQHALDDIARQKNQKLSLGQEMERAEALQEALLHENQCLDHILELNERHQYSRQHLLTLLKIQSPSAYEKYNRITFPLRLKPKFEDYLNKIYFANEEKIQQAEQIQDRVRIFREGVSRDIDNLYSA